ncbi:MAG: proline--tRNA ligase, partial [Acidobacteria bacterium]|nr:proline--tRNA ligase [Acidobacteriota bacterium]
TSWGLSTRFIGAIIMVHGDDQGLVLPPKLAPFQVVLVPIWKTDSEKGQVLEAATKIQKALLDAQIRVKMDLRDGVSPGFKFNDWEMRGVPVRIELGPKDVAAGSAVLARRDKPGKEGKTPVPQSAIVENVLRLLDEIQKSMHDGALAFRKANTKEASAYDEFKRAVETGFAFSFWCGSAECETKIKEETKATVRCVPLEGATGSGVCIACGKPATERGYFGRAY